MLQLLIFYGSIILCKNASNINTHKGAVYMENKYLYEGWRGFT